MKQNYEVLAEGWLEDGNGNGAFRAVGDLVALTPPQAAWLIRAGTLGEPTPPKVTKKSD